MGNNQSRMMKKPLVACNNHKFIGAGFIKRFNKARIEIEKFNVKSRESWYECKKWANPNLRY